MRKTLCTIRRHQQTALYAEVTKKYGRFIVHTRVVCECGAEWWE